MNRLSSEVSLSLTFPTKATALSPVFARRRSRSYERQRHVGLPVRFRYTPCGKRRQSTMQLDAFEFPRRFLQHVLPNGFQKVRYHGLLHPNSMDSIELVRLPIRASRGRNYDPEPLTPSPRPQSLLCPDCSEPLI